MQVNITLLLQMCNFFIAWFLLHTFYFKPAIAALDLEQEEQDAVDSQKVTWRDYVTAKQHEIHTCWRKLKHFARHHMPEEVLPEQSDRIIKVASDVTEKVSENHLNGSAHEKLVTDLKNKIIAEVPHVEL